MIVVSLVYDIRRWALHWNWYCSICLHMVSISFCIRASAACSNGIAAIKEMNMRMVMHIDEGDYNDNVDFLVLGRAQGSINGYME
ncbi:hypothetical protein AKJ16_DCAP01879 [Drosera capensis]